MKKLLTALSLVLVATLCFATLSTDYEPAQYNTNGSTTQYQVQWGFFAKTDLVVYHTDSDGVDTTLTEGVGSGKYTVYAPNSEYADGATITTGTTYPSGGTITIERQVPYGQELSINGDFVPAKPLETQLDKLSAQIQQTKDSIGRTVTIPVTDPTTTTTELPNAETRAGKVQAYDDDGNVTVVSLTDSGTIAVDEDTLTLSTNNIISIKASGVGDTELEDASIETDKIAQLSTNVTTSSQTNLVTEGAVKGYVDAEIDTLGTATTNYVDTEVATLGAAVTNYVDSGFSPETYVGEESITLPNGLIIKMGITESNTATTFAVPFPNALVSVQGTFKLDATTDIGALNIGSTSTNGFTGRCITNRDFYWQAIGY